MGQRGQLIRREPCSEPVHDDGVVGILRDMGEGSGELR